MTQTNEQWAREFCKDTPITEIQNKEIIFLRLDGNIAVNGIGSRGVDENGDVVFFELLGFDHTMNDKKDFVLDGKKKYKRLVVQRVYPYIKQNNGNVH